MKKLVLGLSVAVLSIALVSCGNLTQREQGTLVGAGIGAGVGGIATNSVGGAVVGGVAGGIIGNQLAR